MRTTFNTTDYTTYYILLMDYSLRLDGHSVLFKHTKLADKAISEGMGLPLGLEKSLMHHGRLLLRITDGKCVHSTLERGRVYWDV